MRILIRNEELKEKLYPCGYWSGDNLLFTGGVCLKREINEKRLFIMKDALTGGFGNGASFMTIFKKEGNYCFGSIALKNASEKYEVLEDSENDRYKRRYQKSWRKMG